MLKSVKSTARSLRFLAFCTRFMLALILLAGAAPVIHAADDPGRCGGADLEAAFQWMRTLQNDDGGFTNGFAPESDLGATADAVIALVSGAQQPAEFAKNANTPLIYLEAQVKAGKADNAGRLGKVLLATAAAGADPTAFGGADLVKLTQEALAKAPDASGVFGHALAMLALANAKAEIPDAAVEALLKARDKSGGWSFDGAGAPDTNTTALAIQALAAVDREVHKATIAAALDYLKSIQNEDGGWPYQNPSQYGTDSDANSTALLIQALLASGQLLSDWKNPEALLKTFQQPDGSFTYQLAQPAPNFLATVAAIPALCGVTLAEVTIAEPVK